MFKEFVRRGSTHLLFIWNQKEFFVYRRHLMRHRTHSLLFIEMKPTFLSIVPAPSSAQTSLKMYLLYRTETFAKLFFIVSFTGLFMYVALAFYSFHTAYSTVSQITEYQHRIDQLRGMTLEDTTDLKYILLWAVNNVSEINEGQALLIYNLCPEINCYITTNRSFLTEYTNFDAIVFEQNAQRNWHLSLLPKQRKTRQKYVFYSDLPSNKYPVCSVLTNNYFNWTWTYKLNSDIFSPFIEVKDSSGKVVAPSAHVDWKVNGPTTNMTENTKTKAAISIIEECTLEKLLFIIKLQTAFKKYFWDLDIYGCGFLKCPVGGCLAAVKDYYFFLIYDPSISEDYVTDVVLNAYENDAVPVVIGGADYYKFLPARSYISYQSITEARLVTKLINIIKNPWTYNEYFQWKNTYKIQKVKRQRGYCQLCALLNNKKKFESYSSYSNFRRWWYHGSLKEKCLSQSIRDDHS